MKRFSCVLLAVMLLASLVACGSQPAEDTTADAPAWEGLEGLHVGYGDAEYTPGNGTPLAGYGNSTSRFSTGHLTPLYVMCLAMTDGEDILLLYSMDTNSMSEYWVTLARERVSAATGIDSQKIILCATHSHCAPDLGLPTDTHPQIQEAHDKSLQAAEDAALAALADLAPATVSGTTVETEGLAFVRHYILSDGSVAGDNFGDWNAGVITDYSMENDPQLVLAKFDREGDKADILLMNFQVHPCLESSIDTTTMSADLVGRARDYVSEKTGMDVIYFTGAAGNQNAKTMIRNDAHGMNATEYAAKLGDYAIVALHNLTALNGDGITITHQDYTGDVWQVTDPTVVEKAQEVKKLFTEQGREIATPLAKEYGFASVYEANAIINHSNMEPTRTMEMNAINIGGLGLVTAPYEMFSVQGSHIKDNSPFAVTVVCTMAGPHNGYIPAKAAYEYGCYESQTAYYVSGTAEIVADKYVEMLGQVKN